MFKGRGVSGGSSGRREEKKKKQKQKDRNREVERLLPKASSEAGVLWRAPECQAGRFAADRAHAGNGARRVGAGGEGSWGWGKTPLNNQITARMRAAPGRAHPARIPRDSQKGAAEQGVGPGRR